MSRAATPRERVLAALRGERVRPVPAGAVTQTATVAQMDSTGIRWPEAHGDAGLLAGLALGARDVLGFEVVRVPFDQTVEAGLLGAEVSLGDAETPPAVVAHPLEPGDAPPPVPDLDRGRAAAVVEAIRLLRERVGGSAAVLGGIVGPFTLASQLLGPANLLVACVLHPGAVEPLIDLGVEVGIAYARRQVEAGADALCVEDMAASLDLTSPKLYETLVLPAQERLIEAIEAPVVLHVCGGNTKILGLLAATGAAALSLDARTDLAAAAALGTCAIVGGVPPVEALLSGTPEDVRRAARACLAAGVHMLAPGCGIPPATPTENLREMARAAREWTA
ncbi:MAG: MtaA/CmuA family methyltransferase [Planctomycetes bacterium]|nr:MtaA/CmuA family methyltransferase [Planctomycetota bacterium]